MNPLSLLIPQPSTDKQVEYYLQWERVIRESVATAYMKPNSIPYHLPTLPLPLLQHHTILQQHELAFELNILDCGKVQIEGLSPKVLNAIVER